jgi:hypothetical protein
VTAVDELSAADLAAWPFRPARLVAPATLVHRPSITACPFGDGAIAMVCVCHLVMPAHVGQFDAGFDQDLADLLIRDHLDEAAAWPAPDKHGRQAVTVTDHTCEPSAAYTLIRPHADALPLPYRPRAAHRQ